MNAPIVSREQADNTITVTGCGDCPMRRYGKSGKLLGWCKHPKQISDREVNIFATCPLKTNSLNIQLKQDAPQT